MQQTLRLNFEERFPSRLVPARVSCCLLGCTERPWKHLDKYLKSFSLDFRKS